MPSFGISGQSIQALEDTQNIAAGAYYEWTATYLITLFRSGTSDLELEFPNYNSTSYAFGALAAQNYDTMNAASARMGGIWAGGCFRAQNDNAGAQNVTVWGVYWA